jgi:hypothetical protein
MITKELLRERTGYDSFLAFKRHCQRSANSPSIPGLTKYVYDNDKTIELDIRPEELFMAADAETVKKKVYKKLPRQKHRN